MRLEDLLLTAWIAFLAGVVFGMWLLRSIVLAAEKKIGTEKLEKYHAPFVRIQAAADLTQEEKQLSEKKRRELLQQRLERGLGHEVFRYAQVTEYDDFMHFQTTCVAEILAVDHGNFNPFVRCGNGEG